MNFFLWVGVIIVSLVLESTLLAPLKFYGARIDLVLLFTIFTGLYGTKRKGGLTGFLGGLLEDSISVGFLGMGALAKTSVGLLSDFLQTQLYEKNAFSQIVISFAGILLHELIYLSLMLLFHLSFLSPWEISRKIILTVIINTLLTFPLFWFFKKVLLEHAARRKSFFSRKRRSFKRRFNLLIQRKRK